MILLWFGSKASPFPLFFSCYTVHLHHQIPPLGRISTEPGLGVSTPLHPPFSPLSMDCVWEIGRADHIPSRELQLRFTLYFLY